jgi:conjugal transfer pilus assembly protein TraW
MVKTVFRRKVLLVYSTLTLQLGELSAKDFGTQGTTYSIEEEDPIQLILQKLRTMDENGDLTRHNKELQKKTKTAIERPKPAHDITRANETRVFYYDPSYRVPEDLKDHFGQVFAKKGTIINPLETIGLAQELVFIDSDDEDQKAWVIEKARHDPIKIILVNGAPLSLSEELKEPVYFDQAGILTKKLGIKHVPAVVTQSDLKLRVEEIKLEVKK